MHTHDSISQDGKHACRALTLNPPAFVRGFTTGQAVVCQPGHMKKKVLIARFLIEITSMNRALTFKSPTSLGVFTKGPGAVV